MAIEIEITGMVFKCSADEDSFYHRLSEIPGIQKVLVEGAKLRLSVDSKYKSEAVIEISAICDMWYASWAM